MICPKCSQTIPEISRYCLHCGAFINPPEDKPEESSIDWDNRILCGDGTCTGTIEGGKCTVCGMAFSEEKCR